jgi:hypothetical protein
MIADRIADKIDMTGECWKWTAAQNGDGYGYAHFGGGMMMAHRAVWLSVVGPIPEGMTLDHLCRNRLCVNPDHLEVVTRQENTLRGVGPGAANAVKTHCPLGHPLKGSNLYTRPTGWRECRTCRGSGHRAEYARRKRGDT